MPGCIPALTPTTTTTTTNLHDVQIMGRAPAELIADYEERLGPAPESVRAFFHALAE